MVPNDQLQFFEFSTPLPNSLDKQLPTFHKFLDEVCQRFPSYYLLVLFSPLKLFRYLLAHSVNLYF
jgi:hypothetical protein